MEGVEGNVRGNPLSLTDELEAIGREGSIFCLVVVTKSLKKAGESCGVYTVRGGGLPSALAREDEEDDMPGGGVG